MKHVAAAVALVAACAAHAAARPRVVIPVEDVRSQGLLSHHAVEMSVATSFDLAPDGDRRLHTVQVGVGPFTFGGMAAQVFGPLSGLGVRIRFTAVEPEDDQVVFGPMTAAVRKSFPVRVLDFAPLAHVQTGLEFAVATPWLEERMHVPAKSFASLHGADAELSSSGWSLRPLDGHLRVDLLACRSLHVEVGAGPEVFVPELEGETEYGLRYHGSLGVGLACADRPDTGVLASMVTSIQYRARAIVERGTLAPTYRDEIGVALQIALGGRLNLTFFGSADPYKRMDDHLTLGVRLQLGIKETRGDKR